MLRGPRAFAVIAVVLATCALAGEPVSPCAVGDRPCAAREIRKNPAKSLAFWREALARPIEQRIGPGPPELVDLIALDNVGNGFPNKPRASVLSEAFMADVRGAFAELPDVVKRRVAGKLAGVYFIDDIGGTGFSDQVYEADSRPVAGFIVLDPLVLAPQTANAWATWKENTPFKPDPAYRLEARIEEPANDNRKHAIQYILLHELGHVLAVNANFHPNWNIAAKDVASSGEFPFFELSWRIARPENRYESRFDAGFPQRRSVVYYFGARLAGADMPATYERLEQTNFATLYAATQPGDDFAEAFASYVHTVLMKRPFEIRISRDGALVKRYGSCWSEPRCADKRRILEALLGAG